MLALRSVCVREPLAYVLARVVLWARFLVAGIHPTITGIVLMLVLGKPLGVISASGIASRLVIAVRPRGVTWRGIAVVGGLAGIGFTMAIFIAGFAFPGSPDHRVAKLGILVASLIAGVGALVLVRLLLPAPVPDVMPLSEHKAETATED